MTPNQVQLPNVNNRAKPEGRADLQTSNQEKGTTEQMGQIHQAGIVKRRATDSGG
jgi:hypothetical protein